MHFSAGVHFSAPLVVPRNAPPPENAPPIFSPFLRLLGIIKGIMHDLRPFN